MALKLDGLSVPLTSTSVNANVVDEDATVLLTQQFINPIFKEEGKQLEAVYKFPLQSSSAVYFFKTVFISETGEVIKTLVGKAVDKRAARDNYEEAKANGKAAQLLEQDFNNSPDGFIISLGNIPSNAKTVNVEIGYYVTLVEEEKGNVRRFLFPAVLAGRYGTEVENPWTKHNVATESSSFEIEVNVSLSEHISLVESPSHRITTKLMVDRVPSKASVSCSVLNEVLKDDFVLKIGGGEAPSSMILVQDPSTILNDTFLKSFGDATIAKLTFRCPDSAEDEAEGVGKQNFVFVVDRSGSMEGECMENCKKALQIYLSSLPEDCLFNICSFGDSHSLLFPESREYSEDSVKEARAHVDAMSADMGGTEILAPLKGIVESENSDLPRIVFLFTAGKVSNTEETLQIIKEAHKKSGARMFTCGIGSGVSTHLIEGLAKAGGGTSTFIAFNEKINVKIKSQMEQAIYPAFQNLRVEMGDLELCKAKIAWDIHSLMPDFALNGQNLSCFIALKTESVIDIEEKIAAGESVETVQLIGTQSTDDEENEIIVAEIDFNADYFQSECNLVVPALKEQVKLAEESTKKSEKNRALELCLCANIVSKFTSLVAVEELLGGEIVEASAMPVAIQNVKVVETVKTDNGPGGKPFIPLKEEKLKNKADERNSQLLSLAGFQGNNKNGGWFFWKRPRFEMFKKKKKKKKRRKQNEETAGMTDDEDLFRIFSSETVRPMCGPRQEQQSFYSLSSQGDSMSTPKRRPFPKPFSKEADRRSFPRFSFTTRGFRGFKKHQHIELDASEVGAVDSSFDINHQTAQEILQDLAKLQNKNGSYDPTPELAKLVGKKSFGEDETRIGFATAVAIVFMEERLAGLRAQWKLFHEKAMTHLKKTCKDYKELLTLARSFI